MKIYLIDLMKYPELKDREFIDEELVNLLEQFPDGVFPVPELGLTTIGRSPFTDLSIHKTKEPRKQNINRYLGWISRYHCGIMNDSSIFPQIIDLRSRNGTYVNHEPVVSKPGVLINHNDKINLGGIWDLRVIFPEGKRDLKNRHENPFETPLELPKGYVADLVETVELKPDIGYDI